MVKFLSLTLAALLQFLPVLRTILPAITSPSGSFVMRWVAGGVAMFGYHAVSRASSIAISPPTATIGTPYTGVITYSGGHAGSVSSMSMSNHCLSASWTLAPGLTVTYGGGHTANVTGTPSGTAGTVAFSITSFDASNCGSGYADTRITSLNIQSSGGGPAPPTITVTPQSAIAQVGSDVILSGGGIGNPAPQYYWKQGISYIPGATTNTLLISLSKLTNAGVYTLVASNSQGIANAACYLSMVQTPGSNQLALHYTNYLVAGTPVTMTSYITNVPSGVSTYAWEYNFVNIGVTTSNLTLTGAQTIPSKSGIYTVNFNSSVSGTTVVNNQAYDSSWVFGHLPVIATSPSGATIGTSSNVTFNTTISGSTYATLLWYQNQTNLVAVQTNLSSTYNPASASSTTNASLTLTNVPQSGAGSYTVVVTNFWGSTTSSPAILNVTPPVSVTAPQSQTNYAGKTVNFSVTATGAAPLSYQWLKGGVKLANSGAISGVNANVLGIAPAAVVNSGNYSVIVTNSLGGVTSSVAVLSIVPLPSFALSLGTGNVSLSASGGVTGDPYIVQVSTNLSDSSSWVPVYTNTVPANGTINYTDNSPPSSGLRFYRVQFP
jgi:hypothetical protein